MTRKSSRTGIDPGARGKALRLKLHSTAKRTRTSKAKREGISSSSP
ncbi:MAG: hypothetical protein LM590_00525 [Thermofilum sp.]|jgi:hypothetical protein|nr:hypothetical protein [Thermofilum sp.]